ncbi:TetR/AcrR family transcriptional regulator [Ruegeria sp. 2205SS24-7]|uniref:TetR/AcrR family transcriptional regulator n=1 Tax=Ruegeria discodermiae TaxID=3064389 RepID=UPI002741D261|nr:TetR/AcrR family transcriptional regulator [Ruegeria sp. 2205SS24-7]MDP5217757.1 TetR/AcrR family transcriptional regulator [Ruegeria sp. 2205SS24-7]
MTSCDTFNALKHAQIIDAAVAEFQEKGFAAASMDRITARAQVSKRTVYKYFESKEKLYQSIVHLFYEKFADALCMAYDPDRDIRDQLTDLARAEGHLLTSPEVMAIARLLISENLRNPQLAASVQGKIDSKRVFAEMLRDATADGQLSVDEPDEAAEQFLALLKAKAFWPVILGGDILSEAQMAKVVESAVEMMMSRYGTT